MKSRMNDASAKPQNIPMGPIPWLLASRPGWLRTSRFATNQPSLINDINIFFKAEVPKIPIPISLIFDKTPLKPLTCSVKSPQMPQSTHKSHQFKIISTYTYIYIQLSIIYIYIHIYIYTYTYPHIFACLIAII